MKRTIVDPYGVVWTWNADAEIWQTDSFATTEGKLVYAVERYIRTGEVSSYWLRRTGGKR